MSVCLFFVSVLMSEFHATGLIGDGPAKSAPVAAGLELTGHTCTNQFRITDIRGFHMVRTRFNFSFSFSFCLLVAESICSLQGIW